jgi:hypothetical protein
MKKITNKNGQKQEQVNLVELKVMMIRKGITPKKLAKRFRVTGPAIYMALASKRPSLLGRIIQHVEKMK